MNHAHCSSFHASTRYAHEQAGAVDGRLFSLSTRSLIRSGSRVFDLFGFTSASFARFVWLLVGIKTVHVLGFFFSSSFLLIFLFFFLSFFAAIKVVSS